MHQLDYGSSVAEFEDWLACAPRMWTPEKRARPGALACHPARDRERYLTPTAGRRLTSPSSGDGGLAHNSTEGQTLKPDRNLKESPAPGRLQRHC